ncbi:DUF3788 family protein [Lutibacter citreus]|uniref:DUF3788 family protein n=1 Tax=Lutibacter citreus TaxID=2138210 RepID=UPI000DBE3F5F|nr:DUF3788 family protein [Lutibacter citreus]
MEPTSIFMDKTVIPTEADLIEKLGDSFKLWKNIYDLVFFKYPNGLAQWNFPGKKYGWSYRIKDKKRAIIYFLPLKDNFKVAFVFGNKAFEEILKSNVSEFIKNDLSEAKKYTEGRGIRIPIKNETIISDISKLIDIKLQF